MWRTSFLNLPGVRPPSFPAPARDSGTLVFLVERRPRGQHTAPPLPRRRAPGLAGQMALSRWHARVFRRVNITLWRPM